MLSFDFQLRLTASEALNLIVFAEARKKVRQKKKKDQDQDPLERPLKRKIRDDTQSGVIADPTSRVAS